MLINVFRGAKGLECGCFSIKKKMQVGWLTLVRNAGLIGLTLVPAWPETWKSTGSISYPLLIAFLTLMMAPFFSDAAKCQQQHKAPQSA